MNKETLDSFVELMAVGFEVSDEWLRKWLEIYYRIRRAAEEQAAWIHFRPVTVSPEEVEEAAMKFSARPDPVADFIRAANELPKVPIDAASDAEAPPPAEEEPALDPEPAAEPPEGFEAVEVKSEYLRGTAARKFKRDTRERLELARKDKGLSLQAIAEAVPGLKMQNLLSVLEGARVDYRVYVALAAALDKLNA